VDAAAPHRRGDRLAVPQRAEEGAEGLKTRTTIVRGLLVIASLTLGWAATPPALAHDAAGEARLAKIGPAPACTLTTSDGNRLSLAHLRGRIVAVTFIYAGCAGTCPLLTA